MTGHIPTPSGIGVILLAGGLGVRFGGPSPKQFLKLGLKEVALHSLEVFAKHPLTQEMVIVASKEYRPLFKEALTACTFPYRFANPGARRQDSVKNGLSALSDAAVWVCIHDAARPFINESMVTRLFAAKELAKAATLAVKVTSTIKESKEENWVEKTLDREKLWEIQTPQLLYREILEEGFKKADKQNITVTDDVSLAELLGFPVKLVEGSPLNMKITRREDFITAEMIAGHEAKI